MKNERGDEMWSILSGVYNFSGVDVVDLGCGYGDMLVNVYHAGARYIHGYEKSMDSWRIAHEKIKNFPNVRLHYEDIEENSWKWPPSAVGFCFSVLPYLKEPDTFLSIWAGVASTFFIECQYAHDGPGFANITNDSDMEKWLLLHFDEVKPIGKTHVKGRDKYRTIWMCE